MKVLHPRPAEPVARREIGRRPVGQPPDDAHRRQVQTRRGLWWTLNVLIVLVIVVVIVAVA
jgi:hypothetical protein